jgi:P27 family predicted phage terminase small subunit
VEQRRLEGNLGKRALPEPVLVGGRPMDDDIPPPDHLPPVAKEHWRVVVPLLLKANIIDTADLFGIEEMSIAYARRRSAAEVLAKQGLFASGSMGQMVEHPAAQMERHYSALWLRYAEHYALTPVGRTRLGLAQLQGASLADELKKALGIGEEPPAADVEGEAVEIPTCDECGSEKGRRHADGCSRRRKPKPRKGAA